MPWRALLRDRAARQRGSVLSGLLIMVAFLSILIGALMSSLSTSFVISNHLNDRLQREATDSSAVELGLYELANSSVPPVCARDSRGPWFVASLNGSPAAVTATCTAIVPDANVILSGGSYTVNGIHEVTAVHNSYIVGDKDGWLRSYPFGGTSSEWSVATGGAITGPPLAQPDASDYPEVELAVPDARVSGGCAGHCVELYTQRATGAPTLSCVMASAATVSSQPAAEASPSFSPNFPTYVFFGDAGGGLYVYDGSTDGSCAKQTEQQGLGGAVVGQPLVFTGSSTAKGQLLTTTAYVFVVVSSSSATQLQEWQYSETTSQVGGTTKALTEITAVELPIGGQASESAPTSAIPTVGTTIRFAAAGASGQVAIGSISVGSSKRSPTYVLNASSAVAVGGPVASAPYWCVCPGGDSIGLGSTNGTFYLLDANLNVTHQYVGGSPIRTTPAADANGDWYFGADDGKVYDVEVPATGMQMFNAAVFALGGAIRGSPVEGGCGTGLCLYFGSSTAGSAFVRLGTVRVIDLRSCVTSSPATTSCAVNPRLWARAKIGAPAIVGGTGISVLGWSYYSP